MIEASSPSSSAPSSSSSSSPPSPPPVRRGRWLGRDTLPGPLPFPLGLPIKPFFELAAFPAPSLLVTWAAAAAARAAAPTNTEDAAAGTSPAAAGSRAALRLFGNFPSLTRQTERERETAVGGARIDKTARVRKRHLVMGAERTRTQR